MKVVFMGASEYGLQCFLTIKSLKEIEVVGAVTTPEEYILKCEHGKKQKNMTNPVYGKLLAECRKMQIPTLVINKMNDATTLEILRKWNFDLIFVSGWYHIIGKEILEMPSRGVIGLHPSILPKYRGGAPLVWQMINGEEKAGISLFYFDEGVDSGDIIGQKEVDIDSKDTIKTLYGKIGKEGIQLIKEYLPLIAMGKAPRKKQENLDAADIWPQRSPEDGRINWEKSNKEIENFVRAQTKPYPGAFTIINGKKVIVWDCTVEDYDGD